MGVGSLLVELPSRKGDYKQEWTICVHGFSDLSHISPVVFLYLLKACYIHGTRKATQKFHVLRQQVYHALLTGPKSGTSTFVAQCLYILPTFESYREGFSHLIISSFRCLPKQDSNPLDSSKGKEIAARLFYDISKGFIYHDERVVLKILEAFNVQLLDIEKVIWRSKANNDYSFSLAKSLVDRYISDLIESKSFLSAVSMLEHFSIRQFDKSFLFKMIVNKETTAAEKWAIFMGKPMLCTLVQEYIDKNMVETACQAIKRNNLQQEFPQIYKQYNENALKKLAEKGCWDIAERKAKYDRELIEYLVYMAMEAGYTEKVDELCERYSLQGFVKAKEPEVSLLYRRYLHREDLQVDDIIWVDEVYGLQVATSQIEKCKVVGIDCEWKPNYEKGSKPNKVSIMQIAADSIVFILDVIKLHTDVPTDLDNCLIRILQSPRILKLGYNFQSDIGQLACSYGELACFKHYEMLLDVQSLFTEERGGLSGLVKKILGVALNKTRRISNWEQRPLSQNQLEYAALDAAVLLHIFNHVCHHPQHDKVEWKSHIISHKVKSKKSKSEIKQS